MAFAIKAGKGGRKSIPTGPSHVPHVLGPGAMRAPAVPPLRVKPAPAAQREYGKISPQGPGPSIGGGPGFLE